MSLAFLLTISVQVTFAHGVLSAPRQRSGIADIRRYQQPHPAVVRVSAPDGNETSYGSGTLVDVRGQYGLVVTNWHVVCDATGPVTVVFSDGFQSPARVLQMDKQWDLAALVIWRPDVEAVPIATRAPSRGDPLTIAGYGSGNYRQASGRCTQYVAPGLDMPYEMVEVSVQARNGDSGGPIFNERGELAGVLFGAARGTTSGSYAGRVRHFLTSTWPDLGAPAPTMIADTDQAKCRSRKNTEAIPHDAAAMELQANVSWGRGHRLGPLKTPEEKTPVTGAPRDRLSQGSGFESPSGQCADDRVHRDDHSISLELAAAREISWHDLAGKTPYQQAKTLFALIGVVVTLVHAMCIFVE